ncbi:MAG: alpha/beta fold hydrolase [Chromatiaceae bacterium]|nr:alpha/beta fold hydrolase [Chromatiaceae bacterium]
MHGMFHSAYTMTLLARDLSAAAYRVRQVSYPTRSYDVAGLVDRYLRPAFDAFRDHRPLHIVTHSLGGILVRFYLQTNALPADSRIVMLAPPNQGSEVADRTRHWPLYRWLAGRVGEQLGTGPDGIARQLGPIDAEIGVIAARHSLQPWFSAMIPGEDDGMVSVASTRLAEMRDFIVVDSSHTLMVLSHAVREQVRHFLAKGCFEH